MKTLTALMAVICLVGLYAAIDLLDRATEERLAYQRWVAGACLPTRAGETVIIVSDGRQMRCRIYTHADYGRVPTVISSAVMEAPL